MSRRFRASLLLVAVVVGGCASWTWPSLGPSPAGVLLVRADRLVERGQYVEAVTAYDVYLARYADDGAAERVLRLRDTLAELVRVRAELARLRDELSRARDELGRARDDLERLKQVDLQLERRR